MPCCFRRANGSSLVSRVGQGPAGTSFGLGLISAVSDAGDRAVEEFRRRAEPVVGVAQDLPVDPRIRFPFEDVEQSLSGRARTPARFGNEQAGLWQRHMGCELEGGGFREGQTMRGLHVAAHPHGVDGDGFGQDLGVSQSRAGQDHHLRQR